jgi:hypothetical protein
MKERLVLASNVALFLLATLVLASMQTSLWFEVFGYFPGPALWIPCLVYVALYRSTLETVIYSYLTAFVLSNLTAMPEGLLMISCLALALSVQVFKQRIYWTSSSYFMMVCGLAVLFFHVVHMLSTFLLSDSPLSHPQLTDWLIEALLTPLAAPVLYPVFRWMDRLTNREQASSEISAQS